jgi:uncharacterized protein (DUF983 family)
MTMVYEPVAMKSAPGSEKVPLPPLGVRLAWALRLRCPLCGGGPLRKSALHLVERCPKCGLRTERGQHDFFLGAMMLNLAISEGLLALLMVATVIVMWPDVPWTLLQTVGLVLAVVGPFVFYPYSKTLWMAFDLMLHPSTADELKSAGGGLTVDRNGSH